MVVGAQKGEIHYDNIVLEFPFEVVIKMNITFGRLKILHYTDKLSSLPDFSNLQSMSKYFEVNHRSGKFIKVINLKFCLYLNSIFDQDSIKLKGVKKER